MARVKSALAGEGILAEEEAASTPYATARKLRKKFIRVYAILNHLLVSFIYSFLLLPSSSPHALPPLHGSKDQSLKHQIWREQYREQHTRLVSTLCLPYFLFDFGTCPRTCLHAAAA
jgi:hypothetical protein